MVSIVHIYVNTYHLVKKMVKIGTVNREIIVLKLKKNKKNKFYGKFAERAKKLYYSASH